MAGSDSKKNDVFDLSRLRDLVELMNQYDLYEVDLKQDKQQIRIAKGPEMVGGVSTAAAAPVAAPAPAAAPPSTAASTPAPADAADTSNTITIKSPMVGTFYSKPNPESETFVKVGDMVNADTVVCIIEAMKVFNEIPADVSGKVVSMLVGNEESVEFGTPLFKIET